jgi:ATP-dependent DNA helicase RecQ
MPSSAPPDPQSYLARFGLSSFRPGQKEVISAVLAGQDCLCIMPTGGGKSLCYQLPAIARQGLTLVISPLIALMKDQVDALTHLGLKATFINSSLSLAEQRVRLTNLAGGQYHLVYVAPERLRNAHFLEALQGTPVQLLAVDEAHCISEWGHDFRPDYARLGRFRQRLKRPQTIALTATATPEVRQDVIELLELDAPRIFVSGFARPNLQFAVGFPGNAQDKDTLLLEFLRENPGAGIIYASTRKKCGEVMTLISQALKRSVGVYHAGLLPEERTRIQEQFMQDRLQIVVATNAFGMGIDKRDLRFVVHYNLPGTLEAYYQEAGRAGRDGNPSRCLLLYTYQDRFIQEFFIDNAYPSPDIVAEVYEFLRHAEEDPIKVTLEDLKESLGLSIGTEGVGVCERLLEKCGALERLDSRDNRPSVKLASDLPTLVDLLPKEAKNQRKVLQQLERKVGDVRHEWVSFSLEQDIAHPAGLDRDAVLRALRELTKLQAFDYVPAFRGRAIHMLMRDQPFESLEIDFEELETRRKAEYDKLERVIAFATSRRCRQLEILEYFGDPNRRRCGVCDNCTRRGARGRAESRVEARASAGSSARDALYDIFGHDSLEQTARRLAGQVVPATPPARGSKSRSAPATPARVAPAAERLAATGPRAEAAILEAVKMVLSGVARTRGRFGKTLVAQMLWGSKSAKVRKAKLHQLSTFGLLHHLTQEEVGELIEQLIEARLLEQVDVEHRRPVLRLTASGDDVMRGRAPLPGPLELSPLLVARLSWRYHDQAGVREGSAAPEPAPSARPTPQAQELHPPVAAVTEPVAKPAGVPPAQAAVPPPAATAGDRTPTKPSFYWTWRLLDHGFSATDCEQIRGAEAGKILDHALQAAEAGLPVRLEWFLTPAQLDLLRHVLGDTPSPRIRSVLEQLPPATGLRYEHVQLYLRCRVV